MYRTMIEIISDIQELPETDEQQMVKDFLYDTFSLISDGSRTFRIHKVKANGKRWMMTHISREKMKI